VPPEVTKFERYRDVRAVLRDAAALTTRGLLDLGQQRPVLPLQVDGDEHARVRRLLEPVFAPAATADREASLRRHVGHLLGEHPAGTTVDVNAALCRWLPVLALTDLLDLPIDDAPLLLGFHHGILGPDADPDQRERVGEEIYAYLDPIVAGRRGETGPDLIRQAHDAGTGLTADEIVDCCYLLLLAGIDPVADALAKSIAYLASRPALRAELVGDPAALRRTTDEILRWGAPVVSLGRIADRDTEIGGRPVAAGQAVVCDIRTANRDPDVFADPDRFDSGRGSRAHLSFGAGPHRCIGAHLARLQLRVAIEELHRRHPDHGLAPTAEAVDPAQLRVADPLLIDLDGQAGMPS
jgi:cytochrome P450